MNHEYKLLTPGPLTTTRTVKGEMLFGHCTWDDVYKAITQKIRHQLVELAQCDPAHYTAVLMQGSGTFGVESVLTSVIGADDKVLLCTNGAYGDCQVKICEHAGIDYVQYDEPYNTIPSAERVAEILDADPSITHVSMIHSETASGLLSRRRRRQGAWQNLHGGCHELLRRREHSGRGLGHRLPCLLREQVHSGRAGLQLHHRQYQQA